MRISDWSSDVCSSDLLNGTIEDVMFWKSVKAGDVFYSPAGTVHAIGEGLTLVEIQQNVDLTYRLWDYGRPRELHLDDGIAVSDPVPYVTPHVPQIGRARVGKECVSTCRFRCAPYHSHNKNNYIINTERRNRKER